MNRPLKFRAWNKTNKQMWHDGGHMDLSIGLDGIIGSPDSYYGRDQSDDFEVMQYTGLKDKNGVEIYEGDIYSFEDGTPAQAVVWGRAGFILPNSEYIAIIGNICENPELLKGVK